jgi:hypothetical protein
MTKVKRRQCAPATQEEAVFAEEEGNQNVALVVRSV